MLEKTIIKLPFLNSFTLLKEKFYQNSAIQLTIHLIEDHLNQLTSVYLYVRIAARDTLKMCYCNSRFWSVLQLPILSVNVAFPISLFQLAISLSTVVGTISWRMLFGFILFKNWQKFCPWRRIVNLIVWHRNKSTQTKVRQQTRKSWKNPWKQNWPLAIGLDCFVFWNQLQPGPNASASRQVLVSRKCGALLKIF